MKPLLLPWVLLACLPICRAQGLQGQVKLSGNATITVTGHFVALTWNASPNATSYNVYRGTVHGGPYTQHASGIPTTTYTDIQVSSKETLYYVVTAVNGSNESGYSNETVATIP